MRRWDSEERAAGAGLFQRGALWGHEDGAGVFGFELAYGGSERRGFDDHARAASAGSFIDAAVFVVRPIAKVVGLDLHKTRVARALDDGIAERREGDFREEGEDVDAHKCHSSCASIR